jgi:hypothetical protein
MTLLSDLIEIPTRAMHSLIRVIRVIRGFLLLP